MLPKPSPCRSDAPLLSIVITVRDSAGGVRLGARRNRALGHHSAARHPTLLFAVQGEANLEQPLVIVMLAVATAISLFGFESGAASTPVVGLLIEAPAMLLLVRVVKQCERWHERGGSMRQVA
ncbi:MAG: hypothetical protein KA387_04890 [Rubrivivax sp.]|nr:hypothetical protein [Rubrivivax sp.]